MPITSNVNVWGEELFLHTGFAEIERDAKEIINFGEIVYWSNGKAIAIGFGKTPISLEDEIRLADKCNVWGAKFDLKKIENISWDEVSVEKYWYNLMEYAFNLALKSLN